MSRAFRHFCFLTVLLFSSGSFAAVITADATGTDNNSTTDFWGVNFDSGSGFIQSVSFDVSGVTGAFFDFDGSGSFGGLTSPVIGALSGLLAGDISVSFVGSQPTLLTFNFLANSFGVGDSLRFSADTDFIDDPTTGGDIATFVPGGVNFSVTMFGGASGSASFQQVTTTQSTATVTTAGAAIPEPVSLALFALGLVGLGVSRRKVSQ